MGNELIKKHSDRGYWIAEGAKVYQQILLWVTSLTQSHKPNQALDISMNKF